MLFLRIFAIDNFKHIAMKARHTPEEKKNLKEHQDNIILVKKVHVEKPSCYCTKDVMIIDSKTLKKIQKSIDTINELYYIFEDIHAPGIRCKFDGRHLTNVDDLPNDIWNAQNIFLSGWATYVIYMD